VKRTPLRPGTTPLKRTPLRPGTDRLERRTPLRPKSDKRAAEDDAYNEAKRRVRRRDKGVCLLGKLARALPPDHPVAKHVCDGLRDPHHICPTGWGGPRCDENNMATHCRGGHHWIHDHPVLAISLGLLVRHPTGLTWAHNRIRELLAA
jgi:hypothetical protein